MIAYIGTNMAGILGGHRGGSTRLYKVGWGEKWVWGAGTPPIGGWS